MYLKNSNNFLQKYKYRIVLFSSIKHEFCFRLVSEKLWCLRTFQGTLFLCRYSKLNEFSFQLYIKINH